MKINNKRIAAMLLLAITAWAGTACSNSPAPANNSEGAVQSPVPASTAAPAPENGAASTGSAPGGSANEGGQPSEQVTAQAEAVVALVNKEFRLPQGYVPNDLVYPNIPFTFTEKVEKRKLRKEAAEALEKLVAGADQDGIALAGVSGYRSETRQKSLFDSYTKRDGLAAADKYSARPGHSEHQTGLAIDMTGKDGKCAAESCFGGTPEALWLAAHSADYGFIIRYPEGKEAITGYQYEPWHIRYVGVQLALELAASGQTLEEYYGSAIPVSGGN